MNSDKSVIRKRGRTSLSRDETIGFLLAETARLSRRLLYGRLAKHKIRGGAWFILRTLWEGDGVTQRELSERLGMTQPSTLEMLRAMQGDDLVRFERDIVDKRKNRVYLTERALELKVPLLRVAEEVNKATLQRLSAAEQALLKILLKSVRDTSSEELKKQAQAELIENAFALNLRREELIGPGNKSRTVDE